MVDLFRPCRMSRVALCALFLFGTAGCSDRNGEALLETGMARLSAGQFDSAARLLEKAARRQPQSATAHCNLGVAYWELGEVTRAVASLGRAAELARDDPRPLELLGQIFTRLERWEEARRTLADAQALAPDSVRVLTSRAVVELRAGDPRRAEELLIGALSITPGYAPALYNMAQVQRYLPGGTPAAKAYFERFLRSATREDHRTEAAKRFLAPPEEPVGEERKAVAPTPPAPSPAAPLLSAAREAVAGGDYTAALVSLKEAVRTDPSFADGWWALVRLYDENIDDPERAAGLYSDFAVRFPADARSETARRRNEELTAALRRPSLPSIAGSAAADPAAAAAAYEGALAAHRAGDWPAAIEGYRAVLMHDARQFRAALNLGQACRATDDLAGSEEAFAFALAMDAASADAAFGLASVQRERGKQAEARAVAEEILVRDPNSARTHHLLGLILLAQGEAATARTHFQRFVELAPDEPVARRLRDWLQDH